MARRRLRTTMPRLAIAVAATALAGLVATTTGLAGAAENDGDGDVGAAASRWRLTNINTSTGEPRPYVGSGYAGFTLNGTDPRLYYVDEDKHLREFVRRQDAWQTRDLTAQTGALRAIDTRIAGFPMGTGYRVYYMNANFEINELSFSGSATWRNTSLTALTGAPDAGRMTNIVAFALSNGDPRVYYTEGGSIYEFAFYRGAWHHQNLTTATGSPAVGLKGQMGAFAVGTDVRVYYAEASGHVQELANFQGGWHRKNLTTTTQAPPVGGGYGFTALSVGGANSRVYYGDTSDHLRELAYFEGGWHHQDLTRDLGAPAARPNGLTGHVHSGDTTLISTASNGRLVRYVYNSGWSYSVLSPQWGQNPSASLFAAGSNNGTHIYFRNNSGQAMEYAWVDDQAPPPPPPPSEPETRTVALNRQPVVSGFIPYLGQFPPFGSVQPGAVVSFRYPQVGSRDTALSFVKPGRSTSECGDPGAVVVVNEGQTATAAQISAIFGQERPRFATGRPLNFLACYSGPSSTLPNFINIQITIEFD